MVITKSGSASDQVAKIGHGLGQDRRSRPRSMIMHAALCGRFRILFLRSVPRIALHILKMVCKKVAGE